MTAHEPLFVSTSIDYPIDDLNLSFSDYIARSRTLITQARADLDSQDASAIIDANSPFELRPASPTKQGVLLIHGLLDSPCALKEIGLHLQASGYLVRAILLPGHGTIPGHLLSIHYEQWQQAVRYGVASLAKDLDEITLVGASTGATLSLLYASQHPEKIKSLVLLVPAIQIKSGLARFAKWLTLLGKHWPRALWFTKNPDEITHHTKYSSIPFNAIDQVYQLTELLKSSSPPKVPVFYCISEDDATVSAKAALDYFKKDTQPESRLLLYSRQSRAIDDRRIILRASTYSALHIRDFSHIGISLPIPTPCPVSPNTIYGEFNDINLAIRNRLFQWHLLKNDCKRLTFNPDFDEMMRLIEQFMVHSFPHAFPDKR